ncbi:hypothetical protein Purlil1_1756 [Purpureocillium lilacinum]|uniref:Uncharacterized protein n=1 Tax=Purpureocillium lilacinum TaxID=33203 RepID=A0ABR0CDP8_PURLI|nr:hypothetical protein Purlil1_1756 [Purpureocillium lilacinum]
MAPFQNVPGRRLRPTLPYPLRFRFRFRSGSDPRARSRGEVKGAGALFPTSHDHHPFDSQEERQAGRDRDSSRVPTPRAENVPCACHDPARGAADGQWSVIGGGPQENEENARVRARARVEGGGGGGARERRGGEPEGGGRDMDCSVSSERRVRGAATLKDTTDDLRCDYVQDIPAEPSERGHGARQYLAAAAAAARQDKTGKARTQITAHVTRDVSRQRPCQPCIASYICTVLLRLMRCSASMDGSIPGKRPRGQSGPVRLALPCPIPRSDHGLR